MGGGHSKPSGHRRDSLSLSRRPSDRSHAEIIRGHERDRRRSRSGGRRARMESMESREGGRGYPDRRESLRDQQPGMRYGMSGPSRDPFAAAPGGGFPGGRPNGGFQGGGTRGSFPAPHPSFNAGQQPRQPGGYQGARGTGGSYPARNSSFNAESPPRRPGSYSGEPGPSQVRFSCNSGPVPPQWEVNEQVRRKHEEWDRMAAGGR